MRLTQIQAADEDRIKRLYYDAFPADERAPFRMLKSRAKRGRADFLSLYNNDEWVGLTYIVTHEDLAYIFYLAVDNEQRGKHYGTQAILAIIERYKGKRVFLALEDWNEECDNKQQRIKRHNFYKNCGLSDLPYKLKEANVVYSIMGVGGKVEPEEYKRLINRYLGWPMKHLIDMRIIKK